MCDSQLYGYEQCIVSFYCRLEQIPWVIVIEELSPCFIGINYLAQFTTTRWSCDGKWTDKMLVHNIHLTLSTGLNNTKCSICHLTSSCISLLREVTPLSPWKILVSVSLLDSVWQNLRDSIVLESILSSEGQFASSKLSINRDTWATYKSAVMIKIQGRGILAYNEGINEIQRADDWGQ